MTVNIHEAKTQLSGLIAAVEAGEEVIIARRGKPVVRLVKEEQSKATRVLGFGVKPGEAPPQIEGFDDPELDQAVARDFVKSMASDKWKLEKEVSKS